MPDLEVPQRPIHLPENSEWVARTSAAEIIDQEFDEPEGVNYLHAPLDVWVSEDENGVRTDVTFDCPPLDDTSFFGLLKFVSPYRPADTPRGVMADWDVVDRAEAGGSYTKDLVALHARLGKNWTDFLASRPAFMDMIKPGAPPYGYRTLELRSLVGIDGVIGTEVSEVLLAEVGSRRIFAFARWDKTVEVLKRLGIDDPEAKLVQMVREHLVTKKAGAPERVRSGPYKWPRKKVARHFSSWDVGRRRQWLEGAFDTLVADISDDDREAALQQIGQELIGTVMFEGQTYYYEKTKLGASLQDAIDNAVDVVPGGEWAVKKIRISGSRPGESKEYFLPPGLQYVGPRSEISPLISWRNNAGQRDLVHEQVTHPDSIHYVDATLGALVLAYLAPEVRRSWPQYVGIGNSRKQAMGVAQVPLLTLMTRNRLKQSDFVEGIDEFMRAA